jgi:hypothetical protein
MSTTIAATRAAAGTFGRLSRRIAESITPEAVKNQRVVTFSGPTVERYYVGLRKLLAITGDRIAQAAGAENIPYAVDFVSACAWWVLMAVIDQQLHPDRTGQRAIMGLRRHGSVGHGPSFEEQVEIFGHQIGALPASYRRAAFGLYGAPGQRQPAPAIDYTLVAAWRAFVNTVQIGRESWTS